MDALTLDQIKIFLAVVDEGSFSKAAIRLGRAQSAITYGIQKLEAQFELPLFDRNAYRASLTEAGSSLLLRARRIVEEANAFREIARSLAQGLEAELTIVLDSMFPMPPIAEALRAMAEKFPTVSPRVYVQPIGSAAEMVLTGACMIGLFQMRFSDIAVFKSFPLTTIDLVPVVAPSHPLAAISEPIETHVLHHHVQLVLTDPSNLTAGRDFGVLSGRTWRLADLGAKQSMLLAGLGWGKMPKHMVENDIVNGRLKIIELVDFDHKTAKLVLGCSYLIDRRLGPAGQWMLEFLSQKSGLMIAS
jgi:DNA-binding transcriptional LysR family regulator